MDALAVVRSRKRRHELRELLASRIFGLACGYEDANDAARLAGDPVHKLLLGRDPIPGAALASPPTQSRFENGVDRGDLLQMSEALLESAIAPRRPRKVQRLPVDLDVTDDPTHGAQQLSFFNGPYGAAYYLPLLAFLTFKGEPEQRLVAAMLRPGNAPTARGTPTRSRRRTAVRLRSRTTRPATLVFSQAQYQG